MFLGQGLNSRGEVQIIYDPVVSDVQRWPVHPDMPTQEQIEGAYLAARAMATPGPGNRVIHFVICLGCLQMTSYTGDPRLTEVLRDYPILPSSIYNAIWFSSLPEYFQQVAQRLDIVERGRLGILSLAFYGTYKRAGPYAFPMGRIPIPGGHLEVEWGFCASCFSSMGIGTVRRCALCDGWDGTLLWVIPKEMSSAVPGPLDGPLYVRGSAVTMGGCYPYLCPRHYAQVASNTHPGVAPLSYSAMQAIYGGHAPELRPSPSFVHYGVLSYSPATDSFGWLVLDSPYRRAPRKRRYRFVSILAPLSEATLFRSRYGAQRVASKCGLAAWRIVPVLNPGHLLRSQTPARLPLEVPSDEELLRLKEACAYAQVRRSA